MTEAAEEPETSLHSASSSATTTTTNQALRSAMRTGMRNSLVKSASQRRVSVVVESSPNATLLSKTATSTDRPSVTKQLSFKRPTLKKSRSQRLKARQKAVDRLAESKRKSLEIKQKEEEGSSDLGGCSTIPEIASTEKQKSPSNTTLVTAQ
jgi:tRNA(Phe) wybutosine-synthesizing methylase Tyw3